MDPESARGRLSRRSVSDSNSVARAAQVDWGTGLCPPMMVAPLYFRGELEFGAITQVMMAYRAVRHGFQVVADNVGGVAAVAVSAGRIKGLLDALRAVEADAFAAAERVVRGQVRVDQVEVDHGLSEVIALAPGSDRFARGVVLLALRNLELSTPDGQEHLCHNVSLSLVSGEALLIKGPTGCGKSSLLRVLAGLWTSARGEIDMPAPEKTVFVPQRSYMSLGSLRDQLTYPTVGTTEADVMDHDLAYVLAAVDLDHLQHDLNTVDDWSARLSLGEQQRLSIARALLRKPVVMFLDESTSAMDTDTEHRVYRLLRANVPLLVSVAHRPTVTEYHSHVLECTKIAPGTQGDGGPVSRSWHFRAITDADRDLRRLTRV